MLFLIPNNIVNYFSLFLQGFGFFNMLFTPFLISHLFESYPSKLIAPITTLIALLAVIINSLLVECFRNNSSVLYLTYSFISIITIIIYFMIEQNLELQSLVGFKKKNVYKDIDNLSKRENQVVNLLIQGYSDKEIASELKISTYTVNDHIKNIYRKYDVHSRFELVTNITNKN